MEINLGDVAAIWLKPTIVYLVADGKKMNFQIDILANSRRSFGNLTNKCSSTG